MTDIKDLSEQIIKLALKKGADEADVYLEVGRESEVSTRLGEVESIKQASSKGLGLRVFKDKRLGFTYTSDFSEEQLDKLVASTVALADEASQDEFNGLPEPPTEPIPDLDLYDSEISAIQTSQKIDACRRMEKTFLAMDKRLSNSEGARFYDGDSTVHFATSKGFYHTYQSSYCNLYCVPVATDNGKMQSNFWFSSARFFKDLDAPEIVARIAAERTLRMLNAGKPKTLRAPVVFDTITGTSVLGAILGAIDGDNIFKRTSFLVDRLSTQIASKHVTIRDDGCMPRGLASSPVDGEGLVTRNKEIISAGKLVTYLYDTYTARKAKTTSTANAHRSYSSTPGIGGFNFYLQPGEHSPEEVIGSIKDGVYITNLMGSGVDIVTGDYSLGAAGMWIEQGELTRPVEGLTVASNLLDILRKIEMVGNDLKMMGQISSPTFKVSEMTVAGT